MGIWIVLDNDRLGEPANNVKRKNIIFHHLEKGMVRNPVGASRNKTPDAGEGAAHSAATRPAALLYA